MVEFGPVRRAWSATIEGMSDPFRPVPDGGDWRNNAVLTWDMGDDSIALGFSEAGSIIVDSWVAGRRNDALFLPIVFVYRHALELVLKEGIRQAAAVLRTDGDADPTLAADELDAYLAKAGKGHSLSRLARRLDDLLGRLRHEALPAETHDVLQSLHQLDPGGDTFRYATVRDKGTDRYVPAPRPAATHVDVVAMRQHFDSAFGLLYGGVLSVLGEYRQIQAEQLHDAE